MGCRRQGVVLAVASRGCRRGTKMGIICVSHAAAVASGEEVKVEAQISEIDRKRLVFDIRVRHGEVLVSEGTHQRFIVG